MHRGYENLLNVRNHLHDKLFGVPDAIVVGEHHYNMSHAHTIAGLIKKYKPEYVLMEAFNDKTPEELENVVKHYKVRTFEDVCRHYGVSLEDLGIDDNFVYDMRGKLGLLFLKKMAHYRDVLGKHRDEAVKLANEELLAEGHEPKDVGELKNIPLYFLHPAALEILRNRIADWGHTYGGEHNAENVRGMLEHVRKYVRAGDKYDVIRERRYDVMLSAAADVDAKVAGCDIKKPDIITSGRRKVSEDLLKDISPFCEPVARRVARKYTLSSESSGDDHSMFNRFFREFCDALKPIRDHTMFWNIFEYARKRNSCAPVMAIVGRAHTRGIGKKLKKADVNHRIINLLPVTSGSVHGLTRGNL